MKTWRPQRSPWGVLGVVLRFITANPGIKEAQVSPGAFSILKKQLRDYFIGPYEIGEDYVMVFDVRVTKL